MKVYLQKKVRPLAVAFSVVFISALGPTELHSSSVEQADSGDYVLFVSDAVQVAELVNSVGGSVDTQSRALNVVRASMTEEQVRLVSRSALVSRISEFSGSDVSVASENKVASVWWMK